MITTKGTKITITTSAVQNIFCLEFFALKKIICTLLSQWEFFPWEVRAAFPEKSQLQQSHATQPELMTSLV